MGPLGLRRSQLLLPTKLRSWLHLDQHWQFKHCGHHCCSPGTQEHIRLNSSKYEEVPAAGGYGIQLTDPASQGKKEDNDEVYSGAIYSWLMRAFKSLLIHWDSTSKIQVDMLSSEQHMHILRPLSCDGKSHVLAVDSNPYRRGHCEHWTRTLTIQAPPPPICWTVSRMFSCKIKAMYLLCSWEI